MQLSHGGWRTDPARHRATLHIALHFFLPGLLGLFSLLAGSADGGLLWRTTFVIGGAIGLLESLAYLRSGELPHGVVHRLLSCLDPVLFLGVVGAAFLPAKALTLTPLQVEGIATGLLFTSGLCSAWLAFAERVVVEEPAGAVSPAPSAPPAGTP